MFSVVPKRCLGMRLAKRRLANPIRGSESGIGRGISEAKQRLGTTKIWIGKDNSDIIRIGLAPKLDCGNFDNERKGGKLMPSKKTTPPKRKIFTIRGPYDIPKTREKHGRAIDSKSDVGKFWKESGAEELKEKIGCYLYAFRAGKGYTPLYVGKTLVGFGAECFTSAKLGHYNRAFTRVKSGTPVMFFVTPNWNAKPPKNRKSLVAKMIGKIEQLLIELAYSANPDGLLNKHYAKRAWGIQGMHKEAGGQGNRHSSDFRRMLNLSGLNG